MNKSIQRPKVISLRSNIAQKIKMIFVATSIFAGLGMISQGAYAQDKSDTIEITGTRIRTPGAVSNSPIFSVTEDEIQGKQPVAIEEFFRELPAAVPAVGQNTNNGTGGGATIDLRGLNPNRTLILLDGRRLAPFDLTGRVDTNSVPTSLIQRIDLVTGGASAVYGADAISGVVNFILKKNFSGLDLRTSKGWSYNKDALRSRTDLTLGGNLDEGRGNIVLSIGVTDTQPLYQDKRKIGLAALSSVTGNEQGSGTTVPASFQVASVAGVTPNPIAGTTQINTTTGTLVPQYQLYNFNPANLYITPLDRLQVTSLATYKLNKFAEAYTQVFYTRSDVESDAASSGTFLNVYQVPIGNPFIPAAARAQICAARNIPAAQCVLGNATEVPMAIGRRITELGPRIQNYNNKTLQAVVGLRGDIINDWTYDAYASRGEVTQSLNRLHSGSLSKVQQALRALNATSCTDTSNGCVPLNVFGAEGTITPAMIAFIDLGAVVNSKVEQTIFSASATGDLGNKFKSPFASSPIGAALGAEQRKMIASNQSDGASQIQGEVLGTGAPTPDRSGTFKLKEVFGEALVPLVSDAPAASSLSLELGYRRSNFTTTTSQSYNSFKYGLSWSPIQELRLRGMKQRATRAPNINELYAPLVTGLSNRAVDPCQLALINQAQANTAGTLSNLCRLTGVPLTQIGALPIPSAGQINQLQGGNPALGPEIANTNTLGFVWQSSAIKKLNVSLDYYKIKITSAISSPSVADIIDGCYSAASNPSFTVNAACGQIFRGALGTFNGVDAKGVLTPQSNLGYQGTKGFDLTVNYGFDLKALGADSKWGSIAMSFSANKVTGFDIQPTPTSILRDCLGFYSVACGAPSFKQKWNQRTTWTMGDFDASYNWRHLDSVIVEPLAGTFFPAFSTIKAYNYIDLGADWQVHKNVRISLSINNALNKEAPLVGATIGPTGSNNGNTFPSIYDVIGRYYTVGLDFKF